MKNRKLLSLTLFAVLLLLHGAPAVSSEIKVAPSIFIAHAGGGFKGLPYTNSLEALNSNYARGFRFFEIDFSWTADGELVAIHDWDKTFRRVFFVPDGIKVPTLHQFMELKSRNSLTQLSMQDVFHWAKQKGDAHIVSDIKEDNVKFLIEMKNDYKDYLAFLIPQVYNYEEYKEAVKLGYENIILTLYRMGTVDAPTLIKFAAECHPFAVTMPWNFAEAGLAHFLSRMNTTVYVHTVNDLKLFNSLRKKGVYGIYTDDIAPL